MVGLRRWGFVCHEGSRGLIYKVVDGDANEGDDKSNVDVDHIDQSNGDNA